MIFRDRTDAGQRLAARLRPLAGENVVVLGLPRGGVTVAAEVARELAAPLDVILVRKLGLPFQPELAMGAIGEGDVRVINDDIVRMARVEPEEIAVVEQAGRLNLQRRTQRLRGRRERCALTGRTVIVVDDGIATGATARVACQVARAQGAARIVLAVPVASPRVLPRLHDAADEIVCLHTPQHFFAIGQFYVDFAPIQDEEVVATLTQAPTLSARQLAPADVEPDPLARDEDVHIPVDNVVLAGHLSVPEGAEGVVVFAHGSGSSRHSPRNRFVAGMLTATGLGILLFDLLTPAEEFDRANVFHVQLLAGRLWEVTRWLRPQTARIGYFGASTGAAAALWAAAEPGADIAAVVSRGGRPDLAWPRLPAVAAPTLLIVGGADTVVLTLNERAQSRLRCDNHLAVVPCATHLFEEPGTLRQAAELARDWFVNHMTAALATAGPHPPAGSRDARQALEHRHLHRRAR